MALPSERREDRIWNNIIGVSIAIFETTEQ